MFQFDIKNYQSSLWENVQVVKNIQIQEWIEAFIMIDSENKKITPPLVNKVIDLLLETIQPKDVYNTLWVVLENVNFFLKTLQDTPQTPLKLNALIAILEQNTLHFSKIGNVWCVLINTKNEVLEIDNSQKQDFFQYISSGKISYGEKVLLSSQNLGSHFTQSDWNEIGVLWDIQVLTESVVWVLEDEKCEANISIVGIMPNYLHTPQKSIPLRENLKKLWYFSIDNQLSKKWIALFLLWKEKVEARGKLAKNIVFFSGIILASLALFFMISAILWEGVETSKTTQYKNDLIQAREYLRLANQNLANKEAFELNISKAQELVETVATQKLFLNDVQDIYDDISIIKKQFNGVSIFDPTSSNLIYKWNFDDASKLIEINKKLYILWKNSIYGPIISGQDAQKSIFKDLEVDDEFLDGVWVGDDIIITTKKQRVVSFGKDAQFKYINVIGQNTWQWSPLINTYNGNIYMTNQEQNQIYKHAPSSGSFTAWVDYLSESDANYIGKIVSLGIDGGIYILAADGKLFKFFSAPRYRLESIVLNQLPSNYEIGNTKTYFHTKSNLNYIYILINSKIWIFEPNTRVYTDTKYLTYKWQIEWNGEDILWFSIPRDGEIEVLTKSGIYKVNFEVQDERIIIR